MTIPASLLMPAFHPEKGDAFRTKGDTIAARATGDGFLPNAVFHVFHPVGLASALSNTSHLQHARQAARGFA